MAKSKKKLAEELAEAEASNNKSAQILRCTSCEEDAVQWNGFGWVCLECGFINDYQI